MNLTAAQYANVVNQLVDRDRAGKLSDSPEQRRADRSIFRCRMQIEIADGTRQVVTVRDLSARGIGFFAHSRIERGTEFVIQLAREGTTAARILCRVAHCREMPGKVFSIGAELTCIVNPRRAKQAEQELERIQNSMFK